MPNLTPCPLSREHDDDSWYGGAHMVDHPLFLAVIVGLSYLLIWAVYRLRRWREHRGYHHLHRDERLERAKADYAIHDAKLRNDERRRLRLDRDEQRRRAQWDAAHGPLLAPLEISNREESRWPVGAALQGAATVTASLLIAGIIWSVKGSRPGLPE